MGWRDLIVDLNSLGVGDLATIRERLGGAVRELRDQGQDDLAERLEAADAALGRGELAEYRRLLSQVVSRIGHLKT